jgi:hypothetical protein
VAEKQYLVDDDFIKEFRRLQRWVKNFRGTGVTNTPDGATILIPSPRTQPPPATPRGLFLVKVEKTGGANATSPSTKATWSYTVRTVDWTGSGTSADYELATATMPSKPRPFGPMTFQTGSQGYGVGQFIEGSFLLWDAGEVEEVEACPS